MKFTDDGDDERAAWNDDLAAEAVYDNNGVCRGLCSAAAISSMCHKRLSLKAGL